MEKKAQETNGLARCQWGRRETRGATEGWAWISLSTLAGPFCPEQAIGEYKWATHQRRHQTLVTLFPPPFSVLVIFLLRLPHHFGTVRWSGPNNTVDGKTNGVLPPPPKEKSQQAALLVGGNNVDPSGWETVGLDRRVPPCNRGALTAQAWLFKDKPPETLGSDSQQCGPSLWPLWPPEPPSGRSWVGNLLETNEHRVPYLTFFPSFPHILSPPFA